MRWVIRRAKRTTIPQYMLRYGAFANSSSIMIYLGIKRAKL